MTAEGGAARQSPRRRRAATLRAEGAWVAAGQLASAIGAVVGVRWMTEILAPGEYGRLALGLTFAALANQLLFGPLGNGITRFFVAALERGELRGYLRASRMLALRAAALFLGLVAAATAVDSFVDTGSSVALLLAAAAFAVLSAGATMALNVHGAARHRVIVAVHQAADSWGRFAIAFAAVTGFGGGASVALAGYALSSALVLSSLSLFLAPLWRRQPEASDAEAAGRWMTAMLRFSWPFSIFGIFTWIQMSSDRWALATFAGVGQVGRYEVLYQLGYAPIVLASTIVVQLYAPILFERSGDSSDPLRNAEVRRSIRRVTALIAIGTLLATVIAFVASDPVFAVAAAAEYRSVSPLLPWMALSAGIFSIGQSISLVFMAELQTRLMVAPKIATAVVGAAANVAGALAWGLPGVVGAGLAFSVLYCGWISWSARRLLA